VPGGWTLDWVGHRNRQITATWGAPRGHGRSHMWCWGEQAGCYTQSRKFKQVSGATAVNLTYQGLLIDVGMILLGYKDSQRCARVLGRRVWSAPARWQ